VRGRRLGQKRGVAAASEQTSAQIQIRKGERGLLLRQGDPRQQRQRREERSQGVNGIFELRTRAIAEREGGAHLEATESVLADCIEEDLSRERASSPDGGNKLKAEASREPGK